MWVLHSRLLPFPPVVCNPLLEVTQSVDSTDLRISIIGRVDNHFLDCTTICWDLSIMSTSYGSWNQRTWQLIPLRLMNNLVVTNDTLNIPSPAHSNQYTKMFSMLLWGCNWILFMHGWFCSICLTHLIGRKSVRYGKYDEEYHLKKYFFDMKFPNRLFVYFRCMFFKFATVKLL